MKKKRHYLEESITKEHERILEQARRNLKK